MGYYNNTRTTFGGKQMNSYLPNEKTFYPRRQRDQYPERNNKGYVSTYSLTMRRMIDDIVTKKLSASGKIIKFFFEEYQKGIKNPDKYTKFYNNYVVGNEGHAPISDEGIYSLVINDWNEIIPSRISKLTKPTPQMLQNNPVDTDAISPIDPIAERKAREIALARVSDEEWTDEIYDGCHDWSAPKHRKALEIAYNSITRGEMN